MDPAAGELVWVSGLEDAAEVHLGWGFACARRSAGGVVCWGGDRSGQLGDGIVHSGATFVSGPVPVVELTDVVALAVGDEHACARLAAGSVRCWGEGHLAQLGDGIAHYYPDPTGAAVPVDVIDTDGSVLFGVTQIAAGAQHSCALKSDRTVWCWGMGLDGQLGDGSFHPGFEGAGVVREVTQVLGMDDAVQISAGGRQTCAVRESGRVACWGSTGVGPSTANATDICGSEGAVQVSVGDTHVCALLDSGKVRCWGYGGSGNLGDGLAYDVSPSGSASPVSVVGLNDAREVAAGSLQTCAKTAAGKLYCWGDGRYGAFGTQAVESSNVPLEINGVEL